MVLAPSSTTIRSMAPFAFLLPLLLLFTSILLPSAFSVFPYCSKDKKFTAHSTYQSNLELLLRFLVHSATPSGFSVTSFGYAPNRVHALALCRGDLPPEICKTCLNIVTANAEKKCPYDKEGRIFDDHCHLHYSDRNFISTIDTTTRCLWGGKVSSSDNARFNASMRAMLGVLRNYAVHSATSPRLFAAGEIKFGGTYEKINGMVQCTRDISPEQCDQCLHKIITDLSWCYGQRSGARALTATCSWRYEIGEFFNWTPSLKIPALTEVSPGNFQLLPPSSPPKKTWCVAKPSADLKTLVENVKYACTYVDCHVIREGGNCFDPSTLISQASAVMNLYYRTMGANSWNCDFGASALISITDPSYDSCNYV